MPHPPTHNNATRTRLNTAISSGVLVLLWLLATTAAHAAPKFKICHKPGAANQKILSVGEADRAVHIDHGDHEAGQEVCGDGVDNDCDRVVDEDCCPDDCVSALQTAAAHD